MWIELSWLVGLGLAQVPNDPEVTDHCAGALEAHVAAVRDRGDPEAYRCLWSRDDAGVALVAHLDAGVDDGEEAVSRALAVHMMERLDAPVEGAWLRRLNGADLRLLQDAIHARAGRPSPVEVHRKVFAQFPWHEPDDRYTDARLSELDRANLELIAHPPPPPPPVVAELEVVSTADGCGCQAAIHPPGSWWLRLPLGLAYRARWKTIPKA